MGVGRAIVNLRDGNTAHFVFILRSFYLSVVCFQKELYTQTLTIVCMYVLVMYYKKKILLFSAISKISK